MDDVENFFNDGTFSFRVTKDLSAFCLEGLVDSQDGRRTIRLVFPIEAMTPMLQTLTGLRLDMRDPKQRISKGEKPDHASDS